MEMTGYCPVLKDDYSISIDYLNASTFDETSFVKGQFHCEHNLFGDKCNGNNCPIYKKAPIYKRQ